MLLNFVLKIRNIRVLKSFEIIIQVETQWIIRFSYAPYQIKINL